ncbi:MAG: hypothetical protein LBN25_00225 [Christensenellaceae bacterium]|nr:hypothetical protein [Christensenellaceae bacterium]
MKYISVQARVSLFTPEQKAVLVQGTAGSEKDAIEARIAAMEAEIASHITVKLDETGSSNILGQPVDCFLYGKKFRLIFDGEGYEAYANAEEYGRLFRFMGFELNGVNLYKRLAGGYPDIATDNEYTFILEESENGNVHFIKNSQTGYWLNITARFMPIINVTLENEYKSGTSTYFDPGVISLTSVSDGDAKLNYAYSAKRVSALTNENERNNKTVRIPLEINDYSATNKNAIESAYNVYTSSLITLNWDSHATKSYDFAFVQWEYKDPYEQDPTLVWKKLTIPVISGSAETYTYVFNAEELLRFTYWKIVSGYSGYPNGVSYAGFKYEADMYSGDFFTEKKAINTLQIRAVFERVIKVTVKPEIMWENEWTIDPTRASFAVPTVNSRRENVINGEFTQGVRFSTASDAVRLAAGGLTTYNFEFLGWYSKPFNEHPDDDFYRLSTGTSYQFAATVDITLYPRYIRTYSVTVKVSNISGDSSNLINALPYLNDYMPVKRTVTYQDHIPVLGNWEWDNANGMELNASQKTLTFPRVRAGRKIRVMLTKLNLKTPERYVNGVAGSPGYYTANESLYDPINEKLTTVTYATADLSYSIGNVGGVDMSNSTVLYTPWILGDEEYGIQAETQINFVFESQATITIANTVYGAPVIVSPAVASAIGTSTVHDRIVYMGVVAPSMANIQSDSIWIQTATKRAYRYNAAAPAWEEIDISGQAFSAWRNGNWFTAEQKPLTTGGFTVGNIVFVPVEAKIYKFESEETGWIDISVAIMNELAKSFLGSNPPNASVADNDFRANFVKVAGISITVDTVDYSGEFGWYLRVTNGASGTILKKILYPFTSSLLAINGHIADRNIIINMYMNKSGDTTNIPYPYTGITDTISGAGAPVAGAFSGASIPTGSAENGFMIWNIEQLKFIEAIYNSESLYTVNGLHFYLCADIEGINGNLGAGLFGEGSNTQGFDGIFESYRPNPAVAPINYFGLYDFRYDVYTAVDNIGIFRKVAGGAEIRYVRGGSEAPGAAIRSTGRNIGYFIGRAYTTENTIKIENVILSGTYSINIGSESSSNYIGGIIGSAETNAVDTNNGSPKIVMNNLYSEKIILRGRNGIGGIIGYLGHGAVMSNALANAPEIYTYSRHGGGVVGLVDGYSEVASSVQNGFLAGGFFAQQVAEAYEPYFKYSQTDMDGSLNTISSSNANNAAYAGEDGHVQYSAAYLVAKQPLFTTVTGGVGVGSRIGGVIGASSGGKIVNVVTWGAGITITGKVEAKTVTIDTAQNYDTSPQSATRRAGLKLSIRGQDDYFAATSLTDSGMGVGGIIGYNGEGALLAGAVLPGSIPGAASGLYLKGTMMLSGTVVGGIAGVNYGIIKGALLTDGYALSIRRNYGEGGIYGGVVGYNEGEILDCFVNGVAQNTEANAKIFNNEQKIITVFTNFSAEGDTAPDMKWGIVDVPGYGYGQINRKGELYLDAAAANRMGIPLTSISQPTNPDYVRTPVLINTDTGRWSDADNNTVYVGGFVGLNISATTNARIHNNDISGSVLVHRGVAQNSNSYTFVGGFAGASINTPAMDMPLIYDNEMYDTWFGVYLLVDADQYTTTSTYPKIRAGALTGYHTSNTQGIATLFGADSNGNFYKNTYQNHFSYDSVAGTYSEAGASNVTFVDSITTGFVGDNRIVMHSGSYIGKTMAVGYSDSEAGVDYIQEGQGGGTAKLTHSIGYNIAKYEVRIDSSVRSYEAREKGSLVGLQGMSDSEHTAYAGPENYDYQNWNTLFFQHSANIYRNAYEVPGMGTNGAYVGTAVWETGGIAISKMVGFSPVVGTGGWSTEFLRFWMTQDGLSDPEKAEQKWRRVDDTELLTRLWNYSPYDINTAIGTWLIVSEIKMVLHDPSGGHPDVGVNTPPSMDVYLGAGYGDKITYSDPQVGTGPDFPWIGQVITAYNEGPKGIADPLLFTANVLANQAALGGFDRVIEYTYNGTYRIIQQL